MGYTWPTASGTRYWCVVGERTKYGMMRGVEEWKSTQRSRFPAISSLCQIAKARPQLPDEREFRQF